MLCWCNSLTEHENTKIHPYIIDFQFTQSWDQYQGWLSQRDLLFKCGVPTIRQPLSKRLLETFLMPFEQK